jgi:hypothetical protein
MRMLEQNPVDPKELIYNNSPLTPTSFPAARERGVPSPYDIEESYRISPEGFYTRADRVVDEKGPKAATADEWMSFLKNQQISPKEDQYIGISNWLKQQQGKISKEALQEHIQANSPKLGTYMATGRSLPTHLPEEWGGNPQNMWEEERPPELEPDWGPNDFQAPQEEAYGSDTRYSDMVIPGGKNYSEIKLRYFPKEIGRGFYSEHFPHDQDLMGAVRADERKINGKNTFHMHEMQSDWHQMGSKAGYNRVTSKEELEAASDRLDIAHEHANSFHGYERSPEAEEARAVLGERQQEYNRLIASSRSPIPDAPFKQTWDDLLFKQVLRHAVEKGFDQVSWPGSAETIRKTEQWPTLEEKEGKYLTGRATDVTSVIRRYLSALPELGNKLGKKYGTQVGVGQSQPKLGYTVHTLPLTPAFKKAIMDEGFAFKYQKGGKVEQKRTYTMPLKPGSDAKTVSTNIREFHTGPTYAHTAAKFGKERARKQAIAVAMSSARKYAKGKALGGPNLDMESMVMKNASYGLRREGMINSSVPGRTDKLPMNVKSGSYVLPADIPSALGQGNSTAGGMILKKMFSSGPYGLPTMRSSGRSGAAMRPMRIQQQKMPSKLPGTFARGGEANEHVPIVAAGGEYLIAPEVVRDIGHGDLKKGHKVLDAFVLRVRKEHISTLKNLKPPKK